MEKVLIIDDEAIIRNFLAETLRRKNIDVTTAENGHRALQFLRETTFDMVITDMKMPDLTGIDILRKIKELSPSTIVVVITGFGSIENAVEAMRLGAFNYLIKPFSPDTIEALVDKAVEHLSLVEENKSLRHQLSSAEGQSSVHIIGKSPAMQKILADVAQVATSHASVFIHGESGTGKEVIAHAIYSASLRAHHPFVKVNCAAIAETLIESEFFGHEKGSFTGASARRVGRFELANHGTLLLDEITEIPLAIQAKLLRAIQEQEFERVGGTKPIKVDVRLISTSNRDMKEAIAQKVIREDLYYRLNVVPIYVPPLRERQEDILPLAQYFLEKSATENRRERKTLSEAACKKLLSYSWPGNVRELGNVIERAVVMDSSSQVLPSHLFIESLEGSKEEGSFEKYTMPVGLTLRELEQRLIMETLDSQQHNRSKAAEILGISSRTLASKISAFQTGDHKDKTK